MNSKFKVGTKVKLDGVVFIIAEVGQEPGPALYNLIDVESGLSLFRYPFQEDRLLRELKEMEEIMGLKVVEDSNQRTSESLLPCLPFVAGDLIHCRHKGWGSEVIREVVAILEVTDSIDEIENGAPVVILRNTDLSKRQTEKCQHLFLSELDVLNVYKRQPVELSTTNVTESK